MDYQKYLDKVKMCGLNINSVPLELLDENICLEAVKSHGCTLTLIPQNFRTYDVCLEAVKNNSIMINNVPEQTYELCKIAVNKHSYTIKYINSSLPEYVELAILSIKNNINNIKYIKCDNKDNYIKICKELVSLNGTYIQYINDEFKTDEIIELALKENLESIKNYDIKKLFDNIIEKEIDNCIICKQSKDYYCSYQCNDKHIICLDCAIKINKCYYRCEKGINFEYLIKNLY
jgi:hypothetical protein